jgi:hypothetical protein
MEGKERVIPGSLVNRLLTYGGRLVPDKAKAEAHRLMAEPGSADKGREQEEARTE